MPLRPRSASVCPVVVILLLIIGAVPAAADDWEAVVQPELQVKRTDVPVEVDGVLDDVAWQRANRAVNFVEHQPGDQVQPPVDTYAMMSYDDDNLYVVFVCYDDPSLIRASFTERDRIWSDDYVILAIDTFANQGWAYELAVNPYGVQGDLLWSAGNGEDMTYDVIYHTAAKITDEGWQVEMAIPWTSLRFPNQPEQEWRVDFWRNHPRATRGQYSWPKYDRDEQCWPCQWGWVRGITGVTPGSGLELLPAVTANQNSGRPDTTLAWQDGDVKIEPSLTASYGLTPTTSLEATVNPDFSQVESDADQIDVNSTFALRYPEKRPFFQEGQDLWRTNFNLIYTRSINQPMYAGKLTGRPGKSNFAVLVARDEVSPWIVPFAERSVELEGGKSDSALARYKRTLGEQTHVGVAGTGRWHDGGGLGTTLSADTNIRLSQNYQIEAQAVATYTEEPNDPSFDEDLANGTFGGGDYTPEFDGETFWGHGLYASFERHARHWSFDLDYWSRSPTFRAESGIEPRNDQRLGTFWTGYTFYFEDTFVDRIEPQINGGRMWNFDGVKKDEWLQGSIWMRFSWAQSTFYMNHMQSNELFGGKQYDNIFNTYASLQMRPTGWIDGGIEGSYGHRIARWEETMGRESHLSGWLNFKPIDRLKLGGTLSYAGSDAIDDGRELFGGYITRTRLDLQVSLTWSVRLILQYNDFSQEWDADPLVTYRLNPLTIFYVGSTRRYGEFDGNTDPLDGWRLTDRTYFLKAQYLWQI